MKTRADFNFSDKQNGIVKLTGYVVGEVSANFNRGKISSFDFRPESVIIQKMIIKGRLFDFSKLEKLIIKNSNLAIK